MGFLKTKIGILASNGSHIDPHKVDSRAFSRKVTRKMAQLNTQQQLAKGEDAEGSLLPDYSPVSVEVYGKSPGPMTLHDTGAFYDSIVYSYDENIIVHYDPEKKNTNLVEKYGNIIGLTDRSRKTIKPEIAKNIRNAIRSKILQF